MKACVNLKKKKFTQHQQVNLSKGKVERGGQTKSGLKLIKTMKENRVRG